MRYIAVLILLLLLAVPAVPVNALGDEPEPNGKIIGGVTLEPVPEPTEPFVTPEPGTPDPTPVRTVPEPVPPRTPVTTEIPGPQVGWLTIISTPSGARVSIDGQAAGATPITGRELGAGAHSITLALAGYEPYHTEKTLGAGEQAAVDAVLAEIPVPVPTTPAGHPSGHPPGNPGNGRAGNGRSRPVPWL